MKIEIKLETGNEAFQTSDDVADALVKLADRIRSWELSRIEGLVFDTNGNRVGTIKIKD